MGKFLDLIGLEYVWNKILEALEGKADYSHTHSNYLTTASASNTYLSKANASSTYATLTQVNSISDSLSDYATKEDITNVYIYKGSVSSSTALPATGNTVGDVYNVEDTGKNYAWTGTEWDDLGGSFDVNIERITDDEIDAICV